MGILLLFTFVGDGILSVFSKFIDCPNNDDLSVCLGVSLIVRVSLALFGLHVLVLLLILPRTYCSKVVNEACFLLKLLLVLAAVIALMFLDNKYLSVYVQISVIASLFFLIYQAVALIDFSYIMNEKLVREYHRGKKCYGALLIILSLLLLALNMWLLVDQFKTFWLSGEYLSNSRLHLQQGQLNRLHFDDDYFAGAGPTQTEPGEFSADGVHHHAHVQLHERTVSGVHPGQVQPVPQQAHQPEQLPLLESHAHCCQHGFGHSGHHIPFAFQEVVAEHANTGFH